MPELKSLAAMLAVTTALIAGPARAEPPVDSTNLRNAVTVENIRAHLRALQDIADRNGDTRASGTPGYKASADYVISQLPATDYTVSRQSFTYPDFRELAPATLAQISPRRKTYLRGDDFLIASYSGSAPAGVVAAVEAVDVMLPPGDAPNSSTSGCEPRDFAEFTPGRIALIQRGGCNFGVKAANAEAAGALGVIIFNEGQLDRTNVVNATLGGPGSTIPVVSATFALGKDLAMQKGARLRLSTNTKSSITLSENILAETRGGRADRVIVVGAHLDSVPEGPGINDNGTGTATILEIARQLTKLPVRNKVRFAFWGAEEPGLLGSEHYVSQLSDAEASRIDLNLNFDMLGSPNFVRFVHDGDGSDSPDTGPGPDGSALIEQVFNQYFTSVGLAASPSAFDGRSDYGPFIAVGIPAGGVLTGAEGLKTAKEAGVYGGTAGIPYDSCYHSACDTVANVNSLGLDQMSDAAAHAVLTFAQRVSPITTVAPTAAAASARRLAARMEYKGPQLRK